MNLRASAAPLYSLDMTFEDFYQDLLAQYRPQAGETVQTTDDVTGPDFKKKLEAAWKNTVGKDPKFMPY